MGSTLKKLNKLYRTIGGPAALSSANRLRVSSGISKAEINRFLSTKDSYTLHRRAIKKYPRNYFKIEQIGQLMQVDLADISRFKSVNQNYKYLLVAIDVFSKKLYALPLRTKTSAVTADAMEKIIKSIKYRILTIESDAGTEFLGKPFQSLLRRYGIRFRRTLSLGKAINAERVIRTIRLLIGKYRSEYQTDSFVKALPKLLQTYNKRIHSTIKQSPESVNLSNQAKVLGVYKKRWAKLKRKKPNFKKGDLVRVTKYRNIFVKESEESFTRELFTVAHVNVSLPIPLYILRDLNGTLIKGYFQEEELVKVQKDFKKELFKIEKILRKMTVGGKTQFLVRWQGYNSAFDSWVDENSVKRI